MPHQWKQLRCSQTILSMLKIYIIISNKTMTSCNLSQQIPRRESTMFLQLSTTGREDETRGAHNHIETSMQNIKLLSHMNHLVGLQSTTSQYIDIHVIFKNIDKDTQVFGHGNCQQAHQINATQLIDIKGISYWPKLVIPCCNEKI